MLLHPEILRRLRENDPTLTKLVFYLEEITLEDMKVFAKALERNTTLTELRFSHCLIYSKNKIVTALAKALEHNTTLTTFTIDPKRIGRKGIQALAKALEHNTTLVSLSLCGNERTYEEIGYNNYEYEIYLLQIKIYLERNNRKLKKPNVETTNTSQTLPTHPITDARRTELLEGRLFAINKLDLSHSEIRHESIRALVQILEHNITLYRLNLRYNKISSAHAKAIAKALEHNTMLIELDLSENKAGSEGAKAFAKMFQHNTKLQRFNLSYNQIGPDGGIALSMILEHNVALTHLYLGGNKLGPNATIFAKMLKHNTTLIELELRYNQIGSESTKAYAEMLECNTTLVKLSLRENQIGLEGTKALAKALEHNTTLTELDLSYNQIGPEGKVYLQQIEIYLERNRNLKESKKTQTPAANAAPQLRLHSEKPKAAATTATLPTKKAQTQSASQAAAATIPAKVTSQTQPSREDKLYQDAQALWSQNKFHDVVPICDSLLKTNPNNTKVYLLRTHAYEKLRQLDAGIADCEKILAPTQTANYSERVEAEQTKERLSQLKQLLNTAEIIANTAISLAIHGDATTFRPLRANLQNVPFDLQKPLTQLIMKCLIASKVITNAFTIEQQQAITWQLAIKLQAELLVFKPASKGVFWDSPAKIGLYHHDREITAKDVQTALTNPNNMIRKLFNGAIVRGNIAATTPSLYPVLSNSDSLTPSAPPISHFPSGTVTPSAPPFSNFPSGVPTASAPPFSNFPSEVPTPSAPFLTPANSVPNSAAATPLPSRPPTPPLQRKNRNDIDEEALRSAVHGYLGSSSEPTRYTK